METRRQKNTHTHRGFDGSDVNHRSIETAKWCIRAGVICHFMFEPFRRPFNPSVPSLYETCFVNIFGIPFILPSNTYLHTHVMCLCLYFIQKESISIICCFYPMTIIVLIMNICNENENLDRTKRIRKEEIQ